MEEINVTNFDEKTTEFCVVKFGADWCVPCRVVKNILKQIESEIDVPIFEVNAEHNRALFDKFGLRKIPSVMLYKNALPVYHFDQNTTKRQYLDLIKRYSHAGNAEEVSR
jgi:thioredoxin 1